MREPDFVIWEHQSPVTAGARESIVLPDGCQDLIVVSEPGWQDRIVSTSLDDRPRGVVVRPGSRFRGYRFRPGVRIEAPATGFEDFDIHAVPTDASLVEVVDALGARDARVPQIAKLEGVSERTLQRRFERLGLPKPEFWQMLGRARRGAASLRTGIALIDLAGELGYSDQAHMTRAFTRWFGVPPARLRKQPDRLDQICQPGLGTWTGEHSSIR